MRRSHVRRPFLSVAATALVLGLTACGGDDAENASDEPVISESEEDGSEPAADQPSDGEVVDNGEFVDDMLAGLEDSTTARMTLDMDFGGGAMAAEGVVDYSTDPMSMAMTMTQDAMGDEQIELRLVDGMMYMSMGAMTNGKFIAYDLSDPASLPPGMEDLGDQMDPLAAFKEFEPALKTVTFLGTEDVEGEDLHHYDVVLDSSKLESLQGIPAEAGLPDEVAYDLWFDDDFRMRQMEMDMDMGMPVSVDARLFDWDEPVEIEAPPADQIAEQPTA